MSALNRRQACLKACQTLLGATVGLAFGAATGATLAPIAVANGDVVFRVSAPDMVSRLIQEFSPIKPALWTHVGVIHVPQGPHGSLSHQASGAEVIHAMPEVGVIRQGLAAFAAPDQSQGLALLRPRQPQTAAQISINARTLVGLPFDNRMRLSDTHQIYCTQLIAMAWLGRARVQTSDISTLRVPMYPEPIIHPDSLYLDMLSSGEFSLLGTFGVNP